jgi:hypothetical protein
VTENNESLLRPVASDGDWRGNAYIGGPLEDDSGLAMGYLKAAEILVAYWKAGHRNDLLVVPILSLYRHGIELALKDAIREAAARLRDAGVSDPGLTREAVDERLAGTHSIGELVNELNLYLGRLRLGPENQLPDYALEVLNSLHLLDKTGQAFRYSIVKSGGKKNKKLVPARPKETQFDLLGTAETLYDAGTLILHGVSGVLGTYE